MSEQYLSEIRIFSFNFAPRGWMLCDGQVLPISQYLALFSLLRTTYGGDGKTTFAVPNLQGRVPLHFDPNFRLANSGGVTSVTIDEFSMPPHSHNMFGDSTTTATVSTPVAGSALGISAGGGSPPVSFAVQMYSSAAPGDTLNPAVVSNTGASQPHTNMQPYLTLNFSISLQGIFPSRN
jgi:microcystin-dependent protein